MGGVRGGLWGLSLGRLRATAVACTAHTLSRRSAYLLSFGVARPLALRSGGLQPMTPGPPVTSLGLGTCEVGGKDEIKGRPGDGQQGSSGVAEVLPKAGAACPELRRPRRSHLRRRDDIAGGSEIARGSCEGPGRRSPASSSLRAPPRRREAAIRAGGIKAPPAAPAAVPASKTRDRHADYARTPAPAVRPDPIPPGRHRTSVHRASAESRNR